MKQKTIWIISICILLLAVVAAYFTSSEQAIEPAKDQAVMKEEQQCFPFIKEPDAGESLHIVGLGDSLTVGVGDDEKKAGYIGEIRKRLSSEDCPITVHNFSTKGYTTTDLLKSLEEEDVIEAVDEAHIIVFTIGANDLVSLAQKDRLQFTTEAIAETMDQYEQNIDEIITRLHKINDEADIYFIGFYNPLSRAIINDKRLDTLIKEWNDISENATAKVEDANFIRTDDIFSEKDKRYLSDDHFHPNHSGYKKIAERLIEKIEAKGD